jgi:hypothetical protein
MSSLTTTISTFSQLKPFKGSSAHEWLIFLRAWTLCLNNASLSSVILDGHDITGSKYQTIEQLREENSDVNVFIAFFNSQMILLEDEARITIEKQAKTCSPWIFYLYDVDVKTLIHPGSLLPGTTTEVVIPTEEEISQFANEFGFSSDNGWIAAVINHLNTTQHDSTEAQQRAARNPGPMAQKRILDALLRDYMRVYFMDANNFKVQCAQLQTQHQASVAVGDPALPALTFDQLAQSIIIQSHIQPHLYSNYVRVRSEHSGKVAERMKVTQKECHAAFVYVGDISTIDGATQMLKANRFHSAFQIINDHFIQLGISDINKFEAEARGYTLQFGQDLNHHIEVVKASIQRWMMMELLERDTATQQSSSSNSSSATARILSLLHQDDVLEANSFDLEDRLLTLTGIPIILTAHKRFDLYLRSIAASPSLRFKTVVDHFSRQESQDRTIAKLMKMLHSQETSKEGQLAKANERAKHPEWERNLHQVHAGLQGTSYIAPLTKHEATSNSSSTSKVQANVTFAGDTDAPKICLNPLHKRTNNHTSDQCRNPIWQPLWAAGKLDRVTGLPKDGTALPNLRDHPKKSPAASEELIPPGPSSKTPYKKTPYTGPPCTFCLSKNDLVRIASTHGISTCRAQERYTKKQPAGSSSRTKSSNSSANTAEIAVPPTEQPLTMAQIAQLTPLVAQIAKALGKRKADDAAT